MDDSAKSYSDSVTDSISPLLELTDAHTVIDMRCQFSGAMSLPQESTLEEGAPFHIVLKGSACLHQKGRPALPLAPGDLILLTDGRAHSVVAPGSSARPIALQHDGIVPLHSNSATPEVDVLCGHFTCSDVSSATLMSLLPNLLHVSLGAHQGGHILQALASVFRSEYEHNRQGSHVIVDALGKALLAYALRLGSYAEAIEPSILALGADPRLSKAVYAVVRDPAQPWSIDTLAALCQMSRATFIRHFQAQSGCKIAEFIAKIRVLHACKLLADSTISITNIAFDVGYQSQSAFGKVFKDHTGLTPRQFRQQIAGESGL